MESNPVLDPWTDNIYGAPPFQSALPQHILPALRKCIQDATAAMNEICSDVEDDPTFSNTAIPYETDSRLAKFRQVRSFFICVVNTVEQFRSEKAPGHELLQQFDRHPCQSMMLGRFAKVDTRHLSAEDARLVRALTEGFKSRGTTLNDDPSSETASSLKTELNALRSAYAQAIKDHMAVANDIVLTNPSFSDAQLLSPYAALETEPSDDSLASFHERKEKSVCRYRVPNYPDVVDRVLSNCSVRSVREIVWTNFRNRGKPANYDTAQRTLVARSKLANIMGFENHAQFKMRQSMVSDPAEVLTLYCTLLEPAKRAFQCELSQLLEVSACDGISDSKDFMQWDYKYYSDKLRKGDTSLVSFEELPTFKLAEVLSGLTWLVQELYGDEMAPAPDAPRYHEHVLPYSFKRSSGALFGLMYVDVWTRPGKSPGNWTQHISRASSATGGTHVVSLNCNFERLFGDHQSLNFDHVRLLMHEFGHCLHCLYSDVKYASLCGMSTPDDHVELPSVLHEKFLHDPRFLSRITTAKLPVGICSKLIANDCKSIGYTVLRTVSSSILDLRLHTLPLNALETLNVEDFERDLYAELGMPPQIPYLYESSAFDHIFRFDYRYYMYLWSSILVSSALSVFLKGGPCEHAAGVNSTERERQIEADSDEKRDHISSILSYKNRLDTCSASVTPIAVPHGTSDVHLPASCSTSAGEKLSVLDRGAVVREEEALFLPMSHVVLSGQRCVEQSATGDATVIPVSADTLVSRLSHALSVGESAPPPKAVGDFVIECRNGNISPFEATTRFLQEFGFQIVRTVGNNSHPDRYACMRDGSVVDTDKLMQIGSLCWIQNERDVQALLRGISNSPPQLEFHLGVQGLPAVSAHDENVEQGGSVKACDSGCASLDGLSLVHRAAGTSFVRHILSKGNSTDLWQGFLSFVGGRFDPTDFLRQRGLDVARLDLT